MSILLRSIVLSALVISLLGCGADTTTPTDATTPAVTTDTTDATETTPEQPDDKLRYAWVDNLSLRAAPTQDSKVVATVGPTDALTLTDQQTDQPSAVVLRGALYVEPWLQVTTPAGQTGWVFGGAIRRANEEKGHAPVTDTRFSYPYFGDYDLTKWTKKGTEKIGGGDAEGTQTTYERPGQRLVIERIDMGEYGYTYAHYLYGEQGAMIMARVVELHTQLDDKLRETVYDYTSQPARQYQRVQAMPISRFTLGSNPDRVVGTWAEGPITGDDHPRQLKQ